MSEYEPRKPSSTHASGDDRVVEAESTYVDRAHPGDRRRVRAALRAAAERGEPRGVEYRAAVDDEREWLETWFTDVDDRGTPLVAVTHDVTDRRERIRELERENERLSEFAGVVAHDLRTPLSVATGRLALARDHRDSEHLAAVADALERMEELIEDLLRNARDSEPLSELEPVALGETAAACWPATGGAGATLDVRTELTVLAAEQRLKHLLENLLTNAVQHGGRDTGDVTVTVGTCEGGFYVADDGPGVSADAPLFESGYSGAADGTGFGLSIVQTVAEAHGWTVSVEDSRDDGARFEVTGVETV